MSEKPSLNGTRLFLEDFIPGASAETTEHLEQIFSLHSPKHKLKLTLSKLTTLSASNAGKSYQKFPRSAIITCPLRGRPAAQWLSRVQSSPGPGPSSSEVLLDVWPQRTARSWQLLDRTLTAMRWLLRATSRSRKRRAFWVMLSLRL